MKNPEITPYWGIILGIGYREGTLVISLPFVTISFDVIPFTKKK